MNIDPATGSTDEAAPETYPEPRPLPEAPKQSTLAGAGDIADQAVTQVEQPGSDDGDAGEADVVDMSPNSVNTEPLGAIVPPGGKDTTPLPENGGPPSPPLSEGAVLNERYQVVAFLGAVRDTNMYRVTDLQGYRRCWACGSNSSMPGDIYCVECGAQLAGRLYRLQEFNLPPVEDHRPIDEGQGTKDEGSPAIGAGQFELDPTSAMEAANGEAPAGSVGLVAGPAGGAPAAEPAMPGPFQATIQAWHSAIKIPPAILENRVMGVAHVYDVWVDEEAERVYIAWEEAAGRLLSSWLPGAPITDELTASQSGHLAVPQEPEEEQVLAWMVQAADLLARLHDEGIAGCSLELANLLVLPGDRVLLLDPMGCSTMAGLSMEERDASELSDVRALAGELERWFVAVRKEPPQFDTESGPLPDQNMGAGVSPMPMVAAY